MYDAKMRICMNYVESIEPRVLHFSAFIVHALSACVQVSMSTYIPCMFLVLCVLVDLVTLHWQHAHEYMFIRNMAVCTLVGVAYWMFVYCTAHI